MAGTLRGCDALLGRVRLESGRAHEATDRGCQRNRTNAPAGQFESVSNGQEVNAAARRYLEGGQLVLPLERMLANEGFRRIQDRRCPTARLARSCVS